MGIVFLKTKKRDTIFAFKKFFSENEKLKEMYLRQVIYQTQTQIESLIPCFHKSHRRNLALMVVGMCYA